MAANRIPPSKETLAPHLAYAVASNNIEQVRYLLSKEANPSGTNKQGFSYLQMAIDHGNAEMVDLLLSAGADQTVLKDQRTLIKYAADLDEWDCVKAFLKHPSKEQVCIDGYSYVVLIIPSKMNKDNKDELYVLAELSLKAGAHPNWSWANSGNVILHEAVKYNHPALIQLLLQNGGSPTIKNRLDQTSVRLAIEQGRETCLETFIKFKPKLKNEEQYITDLSFALGIAVKDNKLEKAGALLAAGANPVFDSSFLSQAVNNNNPDMIRLLLAYGANQEIAYNKPPFSISYHFSDRAAEYDKWGCVSALLDYPSTTESSLNGYNRTLHMLIREMNDGNRKYLMEIAKLLVAAGAMAKDWALHSNSSLLHEAVKYNHPALLKILLAHKDANPLVKNNKTELPLRLAVKQRNWRCVKVLIDSMPDHLKSDASYVNDLSYALYRAVEDNFVPAVLGLLRAGANPNVTFDGETPLHLALTGNLEIFTLLVRYGADQNLKNAAGKTVLDAAKELKKEKHRYILLGDVAIEPCILPRQIKTATYLVDGLPMLPPEMKEHIIRMGFQQDFLAARNLPEHQIDISKLLTARTEARQKVEAARTEARQKAEAIATEKRQKIEKMALQKAEQYLQTATSFCEDYRLNRHKRSQISLNFVSALERLLKNGVLGVFQKAESAEDLIRCYFEKEKNNSRSRSIKALKTFNLIPTAVPQFKLEFNPPKTPLPSAPPESAVFAVSSSAPRPSDASIKADIDAQMALAVAPPIIYPSVTSLATAESPSTTGLVSQMGLYSANFPRVPTEVPVADTEVRQPGEGKQAQRV